MYKCPTCNKSSSYRSDCKYCGVVFCNNDGCKGSNGNVSKQGNKSNLAQCQSCNKPNALVKVFA